MLDETTWQNLQERAAISDTILQFARALDLQDWDLCRSCFMDEIETDYADFRGQPPARVKAEDFVAFRREGLAGVRTLHLSTNHAIHIEGNRATCTSAFIIYRFRPNEKGDSFYDSYGYYSHTLIKTAVGWKISQVKQTVLWNKGNPLVHGANRLNQ